MRLVFFSNVHPNPLAPQKGTFNGALVRALGELHDVHVICPISWVDRLRSRRFDLPRQPVRLQPSITASYPTFWYPPTLWRSHYDRFLGWSIQRRMQRELRAFQPDAILSYWAHPDGTVAVRLAAELGIPAITMVGGSDVLLLGRRGVRRHVILNTLRQSDAVIAVSEDIVQQIVADGLSSANMHVVRRGVDRGIFHPGDKSTARTKLGLPLHAKIVVGVGRLVPVKDWATLISACGAMSQRGNSPLCYVLGDGPLRGALEQQIERSGLAEHVVLQGSQSQAALADWYRAADLIALPSLSEGVPNVLLEAIACGTPFVATRVGGIPEIADALQHRLVPPSQPEALAAAIRDRLYLDLPWSRPRVEPLSWQESAQQVTRIIEHCQATARRHTSIKQNSPHEFGRDSRDRDTLSAAGTQTQGGSST